MRGTCLLALVFVFGCDSVASLDGGADAAFRPTGDDDGDGIANLWEGEDRDSDADGLSDAVDACLTTPKQEPIDESGCSASERDGDEDGVSDAADDCQSTLAGADVDLFLPFIGHDGQRAVSESTAAGINTAICPEICVSKLAR